jgi:hypothetical protein
MDNPNIFESVSNPKEDWGYFTRKDYNNLTQLLSESGDFDHMDAEKILYDTWGNHIGIAVKKNPDGEYDFIVWSKGYDGKSGTKDDIYSIRSIKYGIEYSKNLEFIIRD